MDTINFSNFQLIHERDDTPTVYNQPSIDTFKDLEDSFSYLNDTTYYEVKCEKTEEYISIYLEFGKANPRRDALVDIVTGQTLTNPRAETQTELTRQSFFLYYYKKNTLFLSNSKHQSLFQNILKEKLQVDLIIKHVFVNIEEFMEKLRTVNKISFTSFNDLFTEDGDMARALTDLTGTNAPQVFTIEAQYDLPLREQIKNFIRKIKAQNDSAKISKLVVCGLDEQGLSTYFNLNTFTKKIEVKATKTTEGIFEYKDIFQKLLKEIGDEG